MPKRLSVLCAALAPLLSAPPRVEVGTQVEVDLLLLNVGDVASREPVTVEAEQDLDEALALMARHQVRRLPVVEEGRLVGVVAQADVAIAGDEQQVGETLEQISK